MTREASTKPHAKKMTSVPKPPPPHVVTVGGGLAGLAAARQLADRALRIPLLGSRPRLGPERAARPDGRRAGPQGRPRRVPPQTHGIPVGAAPGPPGRALWHAAGELAAGAWRRGPIDDGGPRGRAGRRWSGRRR